MDILIAVTMSFLVRNFSLLISQTVDWPLTCLFSQLRRRRDNEPRYSRHILPRIVRLTIETNTLTGTNLSNYSLFHILSHFLFSYRSDRFFRALYWFPCKRNKYAYYFTITIQTNRYVLFQNDIYYACPYVFSSRHSTFHFTEEDDRTGVIGKL